LSNQSIVTGFSYKLRENHPRCEHLDQPTEFAIAFLLQVINDLITNHCSDALDESSCSGFRRILIKDSNTLTLPNAELCKKASC